jgi:phosphate transport system substrate-binding protein
VKEFVIAKDGIAVIVNPANEVVDLKMEDIKKIFAGEITNWKDVGGKDAPINVISREDGSGTRGAFEEIVLGEAKLVANATIQNSTGAVKSAVASDPNAIGYASLGSVLGATDVKTVKVDGVEATAENVKSGSFKISRPFLYLTKSDPQGLVKAYLDWVLSEEGQKIVAEEYISVK